jgi:hypothetical protein
MEKKEWSEPEMIVLVRSKPEEAVLTACKDRAHDGDPNYTYIGCANFCSNCTSNSLS